MATFSPPVSPSVARVSSGYGPRTIAGVSGVHTGIDFVGPKAMPVYAIAPGVVLGAYPNGEVSGYGNVIVLRHSDKLYSLYAHLSKMLVHAGQSVRVGQQLGNTGTTAASKTNALAKVMEHLHFETLSKWPPAGKDLDRLDPSDLVAAAGIGVPRKSGAGIATASLGIGVLLLIALV